ncbi:gamma-glutamyl-gamma-aminobutyrate hydrolase family protein [Dongia soli]|uniref:Gamma-glutamyl-gamma-aminobutyrate hydrolase family protein n=1 Tax=Dongia soli TaxID=600628 RepID=A0ABU5E6V4_9PROT|nr:gamma-glutamyl-gamma-aminobutyrate hydrolase family protein [Dongia soli]MDY0882042.1 gamma-glutamyl-gamma-aminobutyrate hydrolase family protein [Dongia soli]
MSTNQTSAPAAPLTAIQLPADAPIIAVPMCIKFIDGQNYHTVGDKYLRAVIEAAGGYPLSFPALGPVLPVEALLDHVDGVLFTGSPSNVAVSLYGGAPDRPDSPQDPGRDAITLPLVKAALARKMPVFCICRGFQELNVALGGTLNTHIHDVPGHADHRAPNDADYDAIYQARHNVSFTPGGQFARVLGKTKTMVNTVHWQGIDRLADGLVIEGQADDGVIEAISVKDHTGFAIGTQWHPEYKATENPDSMKLFKAFGDAAREFAQQRRATRRPAA